MIIVRYIAHNVYNINEISALIGAYITVTVSSEYSILLYMISME